MKIPPRQIDSFTANPDPAARVILIYGPDDGKMRTLIQKLGKTVTEDLNDPFNVAVLSGPEIASDPALLMDEAHAISMMGGDRLIRIEAGGDGLAPALKNYLETPSQQSLILVEAGELKAGGALRKLCENAENAAAIACYVADTGQLGPQIRNMLSEDHYTASADALAWLATELTGDHARVLSEINKLKIYMGEIRHIELIDAQAACGSGGIQSMDDFVMSLAGKNPSKMFRALSQLSEEGVPEIAFQRGLQNHFRRLHLTKIRISQGDTLDSAMKKLSPPVFWKHQDAFKSQLNGWSLQALTTALHKLVELEVRCKQTGAHPHTLSAQAFLSMAASK